MAGQVLFASFVPTDLHNKSACLVWLASFVCAFFHNREIMSVFYFFSQPVACLIVFLGRSFCHLKILADSQ